MCTLTNIRDIHFIIQVVYDFKGKQQLVLRFYLEHSLVIVPRILLLFRHTFCETFLHSGNPNTNFTTNNTEKHILHLHNSFSIPYYSIS